MTDPASETIRAVVRRPPGLAAHEQDLLDVLAEIERQPAVVGSRLVTRRRAGLPPVVVVRTRRPLAAAEKRAVEAALAHHLPPDLVDCWTEPDAPTTPRSA